MGAPKGHPRYGGRTKGTPNKKTSTLIDICDRKGINPFEALLDLCTNEEISVRLAALKEICSYIYPKQKAIEMNANINTELAQKAEEFSQLPPEEQLRLAEAEVARLKGSLE